MLPRKTLIEASGIVAFLVIATLVIAWSGADLLVASWFYTPAGWSIGKEFPWIQLYYIDRWPAVLLALGGLVAAWRGWRDATRKRWIRPGLFLVVALIIGPGVLVNMVFKDHWGRPRPREIVQFGGPRVFQQPWEKGKAREGRSFPSGHGSAAFYLFAPFFIYRHNRPSVALRWLAGGICFGLLMSVARIAQGGHFLSDNLWAFGMVYLTGLLLAAVMGLDRSGQVNPAVR